MLESHTEQKQQQEKGKDNGWWMELRYRMTDFGPLPEEWRWVEHEELVN